MTKYFVPCLAATAATAATAAALLLSGCVSTPPIRAESAQIPAATAPKPGPVAKKAAFDGWVDTFQLSAKQQGIKPAILKKTFKSVRYLPKVIKHDRYQPEFSRPIWEYLDTAASPGRIRSGRAALQTHLQTAKRIAQHYGVRRDIFVAIWGMESNYGSNTGGYSTINALATLGFEGRRQKYARRQLLAALHIIQHGDVSPAQMTGSWAGALGQPQFVPTSYQAYAVDEDGDGRRDIWASVPDTLASIANYLHRNGWQAGQPWGTEVRLPADFDYAETGRSHQRSSRQWAALGVRPARGKQLPQFASAALIAPAGARGPKFLIGPNFRAILRYNNSISYALGVALLADGIAGQPGLVASWPRGEKTLSREQVKQLQKLLNAQGFHAGAVDGLMGPATRSAVRAYQRSVGQTADGFVTVAMLKQLQE